MLNMGKILKVGAIWTSIVYIVCFGGVALFPGIREWFMEYALHMSVDLGKNIATFGAFFSGIIIWNILSVLGLSLFVTLFNNMND